jgi:hypothetical protein
VDGISPRKICRNHQLAVSRKTLYKLSNEALIYLKKVVVLAKNSFQVEDPITISMDTLSVNRFQNSKAFENNGVQVVIKRAIEIHGIDVQADRGPM